MNEIIQKFNIAKKSVLIQSSGDCNNTGWHENLYGITDKFGNCVVPAIFSRISFSEDMYKAILHTKAGRQIFFINKFGKLAFNLEKYNIVDAKDFKYGCALIQVANVWKKYGKSLPWTYLSNACKWGMIDKNGNFVCSAKFNYETDVRIENEKTLLKLIIENGADVLEYADAKLFYYENIVNQFKKAIKIFVLNSYLKNKDVKQLKLNITKQNSRFKLIKSQKFAENILYKRFNQNKPQDESLQVLVS